MVFTFKRTKQPTPGTGDLAFIPPFSLPALSFIGPAVMAENQWAVGQPFPQVYYQQALVQDGLNGIPTGSIGQPPLEDMDAVLARWAAGGVA